MARMSFGNGMGNIDHLQTLPLQDDRISTGYFEGELLEGEHLRVGEASGQGDHFWRSRGKDLKGRSCTWVV